MMQVTIPDGLGPGSVFSVFQQDGQQVQIQVPEGGKPGMSMQVAVQPPLHTYPVVHAEAVSVNVQPNPTQHTTHTTMGCCQGCCTWHSSLLLVSWLLFFFNMGSPYWIILAEFGECSQYGGAWGYYLSGCGDNDGYTEYPDEVVDGDLETFQGGASAAFLFGLFAVIWKFLAWKGASPSKNLLITSTLFSSNACLGAFISWGKVADFEIVEGQSLFLNFALQLIASFLIIPSIVMDVKGIMGSATV
jgi:hypothetical protein